MRLHWPLDDTYGYRVRTDRSTRDKAVASLRTYLSGRRQFEELELLKLWKGLFFCMWMSDRPRTQQHLAADLAEMVEVLPDSNILPFLQSFWKTMAREWNGIDVLRMNKFLLLVRSYLHASFKYLSKHAWDESLVKQHNALLSSVPLNSTDTKIPNGMRYHVIDIYIDELDKVDTPRSGDVPMELLLEPLRLIRESSPTKAVRVRAQEALRDERLDDWEHAEREGRQEEVTEEGEDEDKDEEWHGFGDD